MDVLQSPNNFYLIYFVRVTFVTIVANHTMMIMVRLPCGFDLP